MAALFTLLPEAVGTVRAEGKSAILDMLADRFASVYALDRSTVRDKIQEREKLGSTGFGRGVAIPHARVPGVARPMSAVLRLEAPVDFDAVDGRPVDLVFGLLSPFRDHRASSDRPREMQVEGRRQQKTIGDERVRRIKRGIVKHLEIDCTMSCPGGMKVPFLNGEGKPRAPLANDFEP